MGRAKNPQLIGYCRVSTVPQTVQLQRDALEEAGCDRIFQDKISSRIKDRAGLLAALDYLRGGDTLCVWKLDRLGRSVKDVLPSPTTCTAAASASASSPGDSPAPIPPPVKANSSSP